MGCDWHRAHFRSDYDNEFLSVSSIQLAALARLLSPSKVRKSHAWQLSRESFDQSTEIPSPTDGLQIQIARVIISTALPGVWNWMRAEQHNGLGGECEE